ncbi:hypothetical protein L1987_69435 [Smallanthus sonchifolius]|uniref:Uncharacterized protein n=1 Tax=Smallanthus sonchifolius TaxID=185202 RepID=A0ACB9B7C1_9ASTR|nr:hypothetical protein L1987_69435 [Smallanthus sonchifolius]
MRVILRINVDKYNLAPNHIQSFAVSKYLGEDINIVNKDNSTSTIEASTLPSSYGFDCDVRGEAVNSLIVVDNDSVNSTAKRRENKINRLFVPKPYPVVSDGTLVAIYWNRSLR